MTRNMSDMKTILTKLFTMLMLMMFSMGAYADVKVLYGEKGAEKFEGTGGTIEVKQEDSKNDKTKVTITLIVTPADGYKMEKNGIEAYAVISPDGASTRAPEISGDALNLTCNDYTADTKKRTYTVDIDSKLALWVKNVKFTKKDDGSKEGGERELTESPVGYDYSGTYFIANHARGNYFSDITKNFYLCPSSNTYDAAGKQPFLTTDKKRTSTTPNPEIAKWEVEFAKTDDGVDYYHLIHVSTQKYITWHDPMTITGGNATDRVRVHLQSTLDEEKALFFFTEGDKGIDDFNICLKGVKCSKNTIGSLNPAKNNMEGDAGQNTSNPGNFIDANGNTVYCGGLIGIYEQNDATGVWYLEDYIARPTITYDANDEIVITTVQSGATLIYTTDGSTPSSSNTNATTISGTVGATTTVTINPADGVTTIKAVAVVGEELSNVATFFTPVLFGDNHKYLIQSQNNGWTIDESTTDFHFYMIPGDEDNSIIKVNTTSLFRPTMEWHFQNAGIEGDVQYFYIVNNSAKDNSNNPYYLCYDGTNVCMFAYDSNNANKYKFSIVKSQTVGSFNISPYGQPKKFINKGSNSGNAAADVVGLRTESTTYSNNANARWKFITSSNLDKTPPFTASNATISSYYKIASVGSSGHFIVPGVTNATTSDVDNDNMNWYFEEAQAADASDWLTYYHISNAVTGDYLYFTRDANNTGACLALSETITEGSENRYLFTWAKTADANVNYYIIPKLLKDAKQNYFSSLRKGDNNTTITTNVTRGAGNYAWTFEPSTFKCETPVINYDPLTGKISITCGTPGATIYFAHYDSEPSGSDIPELIAANAYNGEFDALPGYYKAVASRSTGGNDMSDATTSEEIEEFHCMRPIITKTSNHVTITCATPGAVIYYIAGSGEFSENATNYGGTLYSNGGFDTSETVIKAIAVKDGIWSTKSAEALYDKTPTPITSTADITNMDGVYYIDGSFSASGTIGSATDPFTGELDGCLVEFSLSKPLFGYVNGATIKNVIVKGAISGSGNVGAIAANAMGDTRIYNCGVLATSVLREDPDDEKKITGFSGSSVSGGGYVGGIVGLLDGSSRVINCFSYANVSGGSERGGIVGHNNYASKADDINHIKTMIMNCMFYGDITGGGAPIYGGENIDNLKENDGLNTFNFYCYETLQGGIPTDMYHCALAVEQKYLTRFEFYRQLLNSNKKLAAIYATGSADNAGGKMAKWVLETADRTIDNPLPFPVLKTQGYYPSIINIDAKNAPDSVSVGRNKGGKLGTKTLNVTISAPGGWTNAPSGAKLLDENGNEITTSRNITLTCTDKDFDRFNFNYDKVQLPYYNDYGTMNYTGNKVVTGWKITAISNGTDGTYTAADQWNGYNFADRKCTNKDKYGTNGSNRVFSQGAYYDVPYGVTAIEIEPYWGKAAYLADPNYDVVYAADYARQDVSLLGTQVDGSTKFNGQDVKSTVSSALGTITSPGSTVYDNAIVLVGNFHQNIIDKIAPFNGSTPFTIMSVDEDKDNEPDYSLIYHDNNRSAVCPIRFDFLNIPGTAQAQKPNATATVLNASVFNPKKWFEITNTCLIYFSQFEYENVTKSGDAPVILLGGVYDQFVSTKIGSPATTTYLHVGGNAWFKDFGNGTHSDGSGSTTHVPISVTGGDFDGFYLTSTYTASTTIKNDDAECYISGGHFKEAAGAGLEKIGGNVHWQIYNADIDNFYGGGVTAPSTIQGDVTVDIFNSYVTNYCGGPKFGDMQSGKKVTTNATGCEFNQFYGAGYGGTSVKRQKYTDHTTYDFTTLQNRYATSSGDRGKYFNGSGTEVRSHDNVLYGYKGPGVATDFDYEFFVWTSGKVGARFFVKFSSFSLAQCNDVESNLTNCTIKGNFYGGGKLGKVAGTVTSVLDDCKVKGNAFGAGFSASFEDVKVRKAGFASNADIPKFNALSGMFESGKLSGTDLYTWKNAAEADVTLTEGGSGTNSTDLLYTDVELTDENLGTVAGNVNLTIKGNSVIGTEGVSTTGNVYGGGDESFVTGSGNKITVTLAGNTQVLGNVFGGGNEGLVEGSATVNIQDTVDD